MARDLMHDIMEQVIEEIVVEEVRNGVPEEKLDEKLSQDNISTAYKNLIEKAVQLLRKSQKSGSPSF